MERRSFQILRILLLMMLAGAAAACGGADGADISKNAEQGLSNSPAGEELDKDAALPELEQAPFALPSPLELLNAGESLAPAADGLDSAAARAASLSEAGLFRQGSEFASELPNSRVFVQAPGADFLPNYSAGDALDDAAYAIYQFDALDYDRTAEIRLDWSSAPLAGQTWLAVAHFPRDSWRWFSADDAVIELGNMQPYIDGSGRVLAVVLLIGEETATLASIRIGEPHPEVVLIADDTEGTAPFTVNFDASGTTTLAGTLTKFEWDFDGDGEFEQDSGTTPTIQNIYNEAGTFNASVRVTNSLDNVSTATVLISVTGEWLHTLTSELIASSQMRSVVALPDGGFMTRATRGSPTTAQWTAQATSLWRVR
jgi:hypothetical protein